MASAGKYEFLGRVGGDKIIAHRGIEIATGQPILLHQLVPGADHADVLRMVVGFLLNGQSSKPARVLDLLKIENQDYVVTTDQPECLALRDWLEWELRENSGPVDPAVGRPDPFADFRVPPVVTPSPTPSVQPTKPAPGEFTQMFSRQTAGGGSGTPDLGAAEQPRAAAPGEFTQFFSTPRSGMPSASRTPQGPGDFTKEFGGSTQSQASLHWQSISGRFGLNTTPNPVSSTPPIFPPFQTPAPAASQPQSELSAVFSNWRSEVDPPPKTPPVNSPPPPVMPSTPFPFGPPVESAPLVEHAEPKVSAAGLPSAPGGRSSEYTVVISGAAARAAASQAAAPPATPTPVASSTPAPVQVNVSMPSAPSIPSVSMPSAPSMPSVSTPSVSMPSMPPVNVAAPAAPAASQSTMMLVVFGIVLLVALVLIGAVVFRNLT